VYLRLHNSRSVHKLYSLAVMARSLGMRLYTVDITLTVCYLRGVEGMVFFKDEFT